MKEERKLVDLAAWFIVRVLYFAGGFILSFYVLLRTVIRVSVRERDPSDPSFVPIVVISLVVGAVAAVFGPAAHRRKTERGRGTLKDIKEKEARAMSEHGDEEP